MVTRPTGDGRINETAAGIVAHGNDGHFVAQDLIELMVEFEAASGVHFAPGGVHGFVVSRMTPARFVGRRVGGLQLVELGGFGGKGEPTGTCDMVVELAAGIEEHLPLFVAKGDSYPKSRGPHLLEGFSHLAISVEGVIEVFGRRKSFAVGVTGGGEKLAGCCDRLGDEGGGLVAPGHGFDKRKGGSAAGAQDDINDFLAIQCEAKRAAHASIVERRAGGVEREETGTDAGVDNVGGVGSVAIDVDLGGGDAGGNVELTGAEGAFGGVETVESEEANGIEAGVAVVVRVARDFDVLAEFPCGHPIRSVGDKFAGPNEVGHHTEPPPQRLRPRARARDTTGSYTDGRERARRAR